MWYWNSWSILMNIMLKNSYVIRIKRKIYSYQLTKWINEWTVEWMAEWMNEWLNEWVAKWMDGMNGWLNEWMNEWLTEWMYVWMNEWMKWKTELMKWKTELMNGFINLYSTTDIVCNDDHTITFITSHWLWHINPMCHSTRWHVSFQYTMDLFTYWTP